MKCTRTLLKFAPIVYLWRCRVEYSHHQYTIQLVKEILLNQKVTSETCYYEINVGSKLVLLISNPTCRGFYLLGIFVVTVNVESETNGVQFWIRFARKNRGSFSLWTTTTTNKDTPERKGLGLDMNGVPFYCVPGLGWRAFFRCWRDFLPLKRTC